MKILTATLNIARYDIPQVVGVLQDDKTFICLGELFNNAQKFNNFMQIDDMNFSIENFGDEFRPVISYSGTEEIFDLGNSKKLKEEKEKLSNYYLDAGIREQINNNLNLLNLTKEDLTSYQQFIFNTLSIQEDLDTNTYNTEFMQCDMVITNPQFSALRFCRNKTTKTSAKNYSSQHKYVNLTCKQNFIEEELCLRIPDIEYFRGIAEILKKLEISNPPDKKTVEAEIYNKMSTTVDSFIEEMKENDFNICKRGHTRDINNYKSTNVAIIGSEENDHLPLMTNEASFYREFQKFLLEYVKLFIDENADENVSIRDLITTNNKYVNLLQLIIKCYISLGVYVNWPFIRNMSDDEVAFLTGKESSSPSDDDEYETSNFDDVSYGITQKQLNMENQLEHLNLPDVFKFVGVGKSNDYLDRIMKLLYNNNCSLIAVAELVVKLFRWGERKPKNIYIEWGDSKYSLRKSHLEIIEMDIKYEDKHLNQTVIPFINDYQYEWAGFTISEQETNASEFNNDNLTNDTSAVNFFNNYLGIDIPDNLKNGINLTSLITGFLFYEYFIEDDQISRRFVAVDIFNIHQFLEEHSVAGLRLNDNKEIETFNYNETDKNNNNYHKTGPEYSKFIFIKSEVIKHLYLTSLAQLCKIFYDKTLYTRFPSIKTSEEQFNFTGFKLIPELFNNYDLGLTIRANEELGPERKQAYKEKGVFLTYYLNNCNFLEPITSKEAIYKNGEPVYNTFNDVFKDKYKDNDELAETEVNFRIEIINQTYEMFNNADLKTKEVPILMESMKINNTATFYFVKTKKENFLYFNNELPQIRKSPDYKEYLGHQASYRIFIDKIYNFSLNKVELIYSDNCKNILNQIIKNYAVQLKVNTVQAVYSYINQHFKC